MTNIGRPNALRSPALQRLNDEMPLERIAERLAMQLPVQARAIVVRCDLAGELHRRVAAEMGLSERHFYRKRREALEALGELIERNAWRSSALVRTSRSVDTTGMRLAPAVGFRVAGDGLRAKALLSDLLSECHDPPTRFRINLELADVCCEIGDTSLAEECINDCLSLMSQVSGNDDENLLRGELDRIESVWHLAAGESAKARDLSERSVRTLRSVWQSDRSPRSARALSAALLLASMCLVDEEQFGLALTLALEAQGVLQKAELQGSSHYVGTKTWIASLKALNLGSVGSAIDELTQAYATAVEGGLAKECLRTAIYLTGVYPIIREYRLAAAFGMEALRILSQQGAWSDHVMVSLDLATARLALGDTLGARKVVSDARHRVPGGQDAIIGLLELRDIEALMTEGSYRSALVEIPNCERTLRKSKNRRFLAAALRVKAEASELVGEKRRARLAIDECLSLLESTGVQCSLGKLKAYDCAARLTGRRAYADAARDLSHLLNSR